MPTPDSRGESGAAPNGAFAVPLPRASSHAAISLPAPLSQSLNPPAIGGDFLGRQGPSTVPLPGRGADPLEDLPNRPALGPPEPNFVYEDLLPPSLGGQRSQEGLGPAIDFSFDPGAVEADGSAAADPHPAEDQPPPPDFDFPDLPPLASPPPLDFSGFPPLPQDSQAPVSPPPAETAGDQMLGAEFSEDLPTPIADQPGADFAEDLPTPVASDPGVPPSMEALDFEELPPQPEPAPGEFSKEDTGVYPQGSEAAAKPSGGSLERLRQIYEGRMAAVTVVRHETTAAKLKRRLPLLLGAAGAIVLISIGVAFGFTPYGFFGVKRLLLSRISEGSPQFQKLTESRQALLADTFRSYQQARDTAAGLLRLKPYPEAQAVWGQAVFYLSRKYAAATPEEIARANGFLKHIALLGQKNGDLIKVNAGKALNSGQLDQALAFLQDAVARTKNAEDLELFFLLAEAYAAKGQTKLAMDVLNKVLTTHKDSAKGLHAAADLYRGLKQPDKAAAAYSEALAAAPTHLSSAVELASLAMLVQKNPAAAATALAPTLQDENQSLLGSPDLARARALNGLLLLSGGKAKEATAEFERALKLDPKSIFAKSNLAVALLAAQEFEQAAAAYQDISEREPQNVEFSEGTLSSLVGAGKINEALAVVKKVNARFPGNARIAFQNARIQEAAGFPGDAESAYKRAIAAAPDFFQARVSLGRFYLQARRMPEAKAEIEQAAKEAPKAALTHVALGELALAEKDPERAKAEFDLSLSLDPQFAEALVGLSEIAFAKGDYQAARRAVDQALGLQSRARDARLQRGLVLWKMGELDASLVELQKAREQEPKSARVQIALGSVMLEKGDLPNAELSLTTAIAAEPSNPEAHFYLAKARAKRGDFPPAIDSMKAALERAQSNPRYHYEMGLIYRDAKRIPEALEEWKRTIELDPTSADAYEALGLAYLDRGVFSAALASFEKALQADPTRLRELELVGDCYFQEGKWDQAISRYKSALSSDAHPKSIFYKLGRAYTEKGKHREAIEWYKKAADNDRQNAMTFYYLGYLYKEAGRRREAISAFKDYLVKRPDAEDKREIEDEVYDLQHQ